MQGDEISLVLTAFFAFMTLIAQLICAAIVSVALAIRSVSKSPAKGKVSSLATISLTGLLVVHAFLAFFQAWPFVFLGSSIPLRACLISTAFYTLAASVFILTTSERDNSTIGTETAA